MNKGKSNRRALCFDFVNENRIPLIIVMESLFRKSVMMILLDSQIIYRVHKKCDTKGNP